MFVDINYIPIRELVLIYFVVFAKYQFLLSETCD
jgi:hypothetical protein